MKGKGKSKFEKCSNNYHGKGSNEHYINPNYKGKGLHELYIDPNYQGKGLNEHWFDPYSGKGIMGSEYHQRYQSKNYGKPYQSKGKFGKYI